VSQPDQSPATVAADTPAASAAHLDSLLAHALAILPDSHPAKPAAHNLAADCLAVAARPEAEGGGYAAAVAMARNVLDGVRAWVAAERALRPMAGVCGEPGKVMGERMPGAAAEKKAVVWWLVSRVQKGGGLKAEMVRGGVGGGGVGGKVESSAGWWCVEGGGGWWRVPMKESDNPVSQAAGESKDAA
jgi:hypothetical protein